MFQIQMQKCRQFPFLSAQVPFVRIYIQLAVGVLVGHFQRNLHIRISLVYLIHKIYIVAHLLGGLGQLACIHAGMLRQLLNLRHLAVQTLVELLYFVWFLQLLRLYGPLLFNNVF